MIRKYVHVDENNCSLGPVFVYGESDAPFPVVPHDDPESIEIGSKWTGTEWVITDAMVRSKRDMLLKEVDLIAGNALRWAALDADTQAAWAAYRQALLDVPAQAGFPHNVTWPEVPST